MGAGYGRATPSVGALPRWPLNGAFVPPDKLADPIIDACAAHVQRLIKFFAGR